MKGRIEELYEQAIDVLSDLLNACQIAAQEDRYDAAAKYAEAFSGICFETSRLLPRKKPDEDEK